MLKSTNAKALWALLSVTAITGLIALFAFIPDGSDSFVIWGALIVFYACMAHALTSSVEIAPRIPTIFSIEVLFLVFFYLIFLLPYQYAALGLSDLYINKFVSYTYADNTNKAVIATTIALIGFKFGLHILARQRPHTNRAHVRSPLESLSSQNYIPLYYALAIIHISLVSIYHISGWRSADEGRYVGIEVGGAVANGVYLLIIMISIMLIAAFISHLRRGSKIPLIVIVGLALALAWAVRILIFGDRNNFFLIAIALAGGVMTYRVKASVLTIALGFCAAIFVYNGIETFRMVPDKSLSALFEGMFAGNREADLSSGSFSITLTTLKATFDIVPEHEPFGLGWYKLIGFGGIFPLVRGLFLSNYDGFLTSAELLSHYMLGPSARWSVGSNIITDIYVDFGIAGVAVLMAAVGSLAAQIQQFASRHHSSPAATMIYLVALPLFAQLPRYSLDFPVRMLVWAAIIIVLYRLLALTFARNYPSVRARHPGSSVS